MKTATYQTDKGPIEVYYDPNSPCVYCERATAGSTGMALPGIF